MALTKEHAALDNTPGEYAGCDGWRNDFKLRRSDDNKKGAVVWLSSSPVAHNPSPRWKKCVVWPQLGSGFRPHQSYRSPTGSMLCMLHKWWRQLTLSNMPAQIATSIFTVLASQSLNLLLNNAFVYMTTWRCAKTTSVIPLVYKYHTCVWQKAIVHRKNMDILDKY